MVPSNYITWFGALIEYKKKNNKRSAFASTHAAKQNPSHDANEKAAENLRTSLALTQDSSCYITTKDGELATPEI